MVVMVFIAVLLGWNASVQRAEYRLKQVYQRLNYAEQELTRAREELQDQVRPKQASARAFSQTVLDGAQLRGVTIASQSNVFQKASLRNCDLQGATLQGGGSAFQVCRFDHANLTDAKLIGGGASFQNASFVGADLTGADLNGGGGSFQLATFENACLVRAKLAGSFQSVNISGTKFEGADLSALDSEALVSCYFKDPPTYDKQTRFPKGFDPVAQMWRKVD